MRCLVCFSSSAEYSGIDSCCLLVCVPVSLRVPLIGLCVAAEFKAGPVGGFPDHPHRGFETVTYMHPESTGAFEHEDFERNKGRLEPGMLQWMTAGRGILHSEMPARDMKPTDIAWGLQLWINLAAKDKMVAPRYQELPKEKVSHIFGAQGSTGGSWKSNRSGFVELAT